nr:metallophosphoesterase [Acidiferrobacterales bacterium]
MKRRHFLIAGGLVAAGVYINQRGLRYPRMGFEPANPSATLVDEHTQLNLDDFIATSPQAPLTLRAIAPEPSLEFIPHSNSSESTKITATNISPKAILRVDAAPNVSVHEQIEGIHRTIELKYKAGQNISLSWFLADSKQLKFAAIGDSGGGSELDWCLTRAEQLGVDFLLHLGDLNYGDGEYDRAITQMNQAAMPVYVTIGNHDFNDSGLVYRQFLDHIGPLNNSFVIAGTRFINVDTAVNFFPAY